MKIKVECPCGTRFEFEVEPVNERMPMPVACPECGADATTAANAVIRAQLRGIPVSPPTASPAPYPTAQAITPAAEAATVAEDHAQTCPRHVTEAIVETCRVCSKPICLKCMEQFGYLCSVYCRNQALHKRIYVPPYEGQRTEVARQSNNKAAVIGWAAAALVVAVFATWYWYVYHGRKPSVVYTLAAPKSTGARGAAATADYYQLIAPGQLLTIANRRVSITDLEKKTERWSVSLPATSSAQSASMDDTSDDAPDFAADFGFGFSSGKHVVVTSNDVWVAGGNSLARLDLQTGSSKPLEIKGRIDRVAAGDDMILVISDRNQNHGLLTRISLPDGAAQTEEYGTATPTNSPRKPAAGARTNQPPARAPVVATAPARGGRGGRGTGLPAALQTLANPPATAAAMDDADLKEFRAALSTLETRNDPFIAAGQNVAEFQSKVLEARTTTVQTMRKAPTTSVLDDKNLNATQSVDLAEEMMNDSQRQRTGGVAVEDVSRYQVTLHRYFDKEATNWTGEIIGPPKFVPMKTVDLLMARTNLYVFDKKNKKLWEAKLEFQVARPYQYEEQGYPALETKDALFFADLGMLTCFELGSGNARWRIPTVGVSAVQLDDQGKLYVDTTPAPPDTVKYPDQVNLHRPDKRIVMKVDPASGRILWQTEMPGIDFHCILDGKYLFTTRDWQTQDAFKFGEGQDLNFLFRFVAPGSGATIWSWPELNKHLLRVDAQQHWILLHFTEKVVVLKFFSL